MTRAFAVEAALRCYPTWWQVRYGDEVRSVADDLGTEGRTAKRLAFDLVRGAIRVRTGPQGMPKVYRLWAKRTRLSIAVATLPWMLGAPFVVMAMGSSSLHSLGGKVIYDGFTPVGSRLQLLPTSGHYPLNHSGFPPLAPPLTVAGSIAACAVLGIAVLFFVTLIVLAIGWSRLTTGIRHSSSSQRRNVMLLAWAPGFALLADIGVFVTQTLVRPSVYRLSTGAPAVPLNGNPAAAHALGVVLAIVAIVGWLVSILCVAAAAKQAEIAPSDLRFGRTVSTTVAALFALLVAAYTMWGIGLIMQARQAARGTFTTITYSSQGLWLPMILLLFVLVALSALGARAAVRSWKVISLELI